MEKAEQTPGVEKPWLPAAIYHLLLAVFWRRHEWTEVVLWYGVVEDENKRAAWSRSLNVYRPRVIVTHHRPDFVVCARNTHTQKTQYAWKTRTQNILKSPLTLIICRQPFQACTQSTACACEWKWEINGVMKSYASTWWILSSEQKVVHSGDCEMTTPREHLSLGKLKFPHVASKGACLPCLAKLA